MLAVVDGADPDSGNCGFIDMGTKHITVPRCTFSDWKRKKTLYVYLESAGSGVTVTLTDSYPTPSDRRLRRLLGRLVYKNGAYATVQEQFGPVIENYHMMIGGLTNGR